MPSELFAVSSSATLTHLATQTRRIGSGLTDTAVPPLPTAQTTKTDGAIEPSESVSSTNVASSVSITIGTEDNLLFSKT